MARRREAEQMQAAEAALAEARERDKAVKALSWELDHMRRLKDEQIGDLSAQIRTLQQVAKVWRGRTDVGRRSPSQGGTKSYPCATMWPFFLKCLIVPAFYSSRIRRLLRRLSLSCSS